ncbi:hypothetical protein HDU81_003366 [Chytriomyces hyalinus]|nr:hypothetical protein HDU81_003366 [Chytriomyces hyalinus]
MRHFDDDEALLPYEKRAMKQQNNLHKMRSSHRYVSPNRYSNSGFESAKIANATHSDKHPAPWIPHNSHSGCAVTYSLDTEAQLLLDYLSPSPHETILRNHIASKYATIITQRFPSSSTYAFGSSGTGLFLPWSDVDLIVVDPGTRYKNIINKSKTYADPKQGTQSSKLLKLIPKLNQSQQTSSLLILKRARVPILKLCDKSTGVAIDVCYNVVGGLAAVDAVKSWVEKMDGLRDLVMLVKLFLNGKGLSDVATGGVGGYSIVVWCMAFLKIRKESPSSMPELQRKRKHESEPTPNNTPGTLFLDFCRYFGRHFDYHSQGIGFTKARDPHDPAMPHTFDKRTSIQFQKAKPYMLCLLNPLDLSVDLTRGSTRIQAVTSAFSDAAARIERIGRVDMSPEQSSSKRMKRSGGSEDLRSSDGIFSQIMFVSKEMVRQRELMHRVALSLFGSDVEAFIEEPENGDAAAPPVYADEQDPFVFNGIAMNDNEPELDRGFGDQSEIVADYSEDEAFYSDYENEVVVETAITEIMRYEGEDDSSNNSTSDIFFMDRSGGVVAVKKKERGVFDRTSPVKSSPSPVSPKTKERKKRTGFNGRDNRTTKAKGAKNQSPQKQTQNHFNLVDSPAMKSRKRRHMTDDFSQQSKKEKYYKPNHSDWKPRNGKRREDLWDGDANFMELSGKRRKHQKR